MILYHGTNLDFSSIDLNKSIPYKDFGRGFYLTDIYSQAESLSKKKRSLFGGSPIVQKYEFSDNKMTDLNVLIFEKPTQDWAQFVYMNRNRHSNFVHPYDIVIGPIANDGVAYLLGRYEEGTITLKDLTKELEYKELNNQYFFGTLRALTLLHRI